MSDCFTPASIPPGKVSFGTACRPPSLRQRAPYEMQVPPWLVAPHELRMQIQLKMLKVLSSSSAQAKLVPLQSDVSKICPTCPTCPLFVASSRALMRGCVLKR